MTLAPGAPPEPAPGAAPAGIPFGKTLARLAKIPLRRWKLSLLFVAVSAAGAFWAGKTLSQTTYRAEGQFLYRPAQLPDDLKAVYTPPNKPTVLEMLKSTLPHYQRLAEEFNLSLPPQNLAFLFNVKDKVEDSEAIDLSLEWGDAEQAAAMVNRLRELLDEQVAELRRVPVRKVLASTEQSRDQWKEDLRKAEEGYAAYLRESGVDDPLADQTRRRSDAEAALRDRDTAVNAVKSLEGQIQKHEEEVARLRRKQEDAGPTEGDEEYFKSRRDLELLLAEAESKKAADERLLASRKKGVGDLEDLVRQRIRLPAELEALQQEIKILEAGVRNGEARIRALKADLAQNKPFSAQIRRLLTAVEANKDRLIEARTAVQQREAALGAARAALVRAEKVKAGADPKLKEIKQISDELLRQNARVQNLRDLVDERRQQIVVTTAATPPKYPIKSTRKFITGVSFAIPVACLFGLLILFDTSARPWRAESLADRLGLPILARYAGGPAAGRGPAAPECRALSLRLRQYVPDAGGVLLFTPLNEGHGVEALVADLTGYFALRDEKVLVLDARIANAGGDELLRCLGRALARGPVEVAPAADPAGPRGAGKGLVQYLVFEGQSPERLIVRTRTPAVDYLPAGGPYPVTDALASESMRDLLESLRKTYSLILVVGPAVSKAVDTEILAAHASGLVLVVNGALGAFTPATRAFFQSLRETDVPLLGAVLCA
jgi:hypothetical protein